MDIFIKLENNIINFERKNMPKSDNNQKYTDNKIETVIILRAKELEINSEKVNILLNDGKEFEISDIIYNDASDYMKISFNTEYEIQNLKSIQLYSKSQSNENNINNIPKNENNINNNQASNNEINNQNKNKENNLQKSDDNKKTQTQTNVQNEQPKNNHVKLVLVKILICLIFLMLSIIIILFVRIKSLQKRRSNYVELTGLDSI